MRGFFRGEGEEILSCMYEYLSISLSVACSLSAAGRYGQLFFFFFGTCTIHTIHKPSNSWDFFPTMGVNPYHRGGLGLDDFIRIILRICMQY